MRKLLLVVLAVSLMVSVSYAEPYRENTRSDGKTGFNNIAVVGQDTAGVPGWIELATSDINGKISRWYIYVDGTQGNLMIASSVTVGTTTGAGDPKDTTFFTNNLMIGTEVGSQ